jgi:opacity protein-like surface antigen
MKNLFAIASVGIGLAVSSSVALAADPYVVDPAGHAYIHLDGTYALSKGGSGIDSGNVPGQDKLGDGFWVSGYAGYVMPSGWDWRVGAGFADLSRGKINGTGVNAYAVDDGKMFNVDLDVGYDMALAGATVRPSLGLRYLGWDQDQGYHPDAPLGCCGMETDFDGFGPKIAFDAVFPISDMFGFVGGADASVLFGEIDHSYGTGAVDPNGSRNRTAYTLGGYFGIDWALSDNISFGAKYRAMYLDGTSYKDANFLSGPSGRGTNLLQGPTVSLDIKF